MNIGINISLLRKEKGINRKEFADALGISVQAVWKWEKGKTYPDIQLLPEIAKVLGVTISDLFV